MTDIETKVEDVREKLLNAAAEFVESARSAVGPKDAERYSSAAAALFTAATIRSIIDPPPDPGRK